MCSGHAALVRQQSGFRVVLGFTPFALGAWFITARWQGSLRGYPMPAVSIQRRDKEHFSAAPGQPASENRQGELLFASSRQRDEVLIAFRPPYNSQRGLHL